MNTQSALSFVPHLIVSLTCTCCVGRVPAAETNFSASITVDLARESFLETEGIRGKIQLKILPGKSAAAADGQAEDDVAPRLELLFDSELAAVPLEVAMNRSLDKSVLAGGEVEVPFEIRTWPEFSQRLRSLEGIARLRRGRHHCYAVLERFAGYRPVFGWNMRRAMNWFTTIGATQHFEIIASGARSVSSEELIQAARGGPDSFKMTIASFFGEHGQLAPGDLLPILGSAGPETKGRLAGLFQNRGGALEGLTPFFERPKDRVLLENHTNAPLFLKVAPGEALRFVYDTTVTHNANGLNQNYAVVGKTEKLVHAPKQPGVYRVGCDIHVSTWAWVLVTGSNKVNERVSSQDAQQRVPTLAGHDLQSIYKIGSSNLERVPSNASVPINYPSMNHHILRWASCVAVGGALSLAQSFGAATVSKTMRVDHGRPVVVVSDKSVLLLEFAKEPIGDALMSHDDPDIRHCRARYRYQFYDGATGSVTNGQGTVEEILKTVIRTATGTQVKDMGSRVGISAGDFYVWWSEGGAGARSWVYYRTDSPIRFIQQPQRVDFESVGREQFQRYLASRNVEEFVSAGKSVQVMGPAVFSGDLPTDAPVSGRVESGKVREGAFELKLSDLATNQHYIIESTYDLKSGTWAPRHTFIARESSHEWSDPLGKEVNVMFYRIRAGAY